MQITAWLRCVGTCKMESLFDVSGGGYKLVVHLGSEIHDEEEVRRDYRCDEDVRADIQV